MRGSVAVTYYKLPNKLSALCAVELETAAAEHCQRAYIVNGSSVAVDAVSCRLCFVPKRLRSERQGHSPASGVSEGVRR